MDDRLSGLSPIVVFLSREDRADRLLAEHGDDTTGHCRTCSLGSQAGRMTWPCTLANYAVAARELAAARPAS